MAFHLCRVQVVFPNVNAFPADACTNTFHFNVETDGGSPGETQLDDVHSALLNFYNGDDGTNPPIAAWLSERLDVAEARMKVYDLTEEMPRQPFRDQALAVDEFDTSSLPMPAECAVVLTYRAQKMSGVNSARRRGRIYIGPLRFLDGVEDLAIIGEAGLITDRCTGSIASAGHRLANNEDVHWCVYSPTSNPNVIENEVGPSVVAGYVDNAFDTQRRRGPEATERNVWT